MLSLLARFFTAYPAHSPSTASATPPSPAIIYGTAWKKERTRDLVLEALRAGYRAIDTACQPKHYHEAGVGAAVAAAESEGIIIRRSDLYLQTKYTPIAGQDPANVPYNAAAPLEDQVDQSVAASLRNLRTSYIDCLILHSPLQQHADTMRVWKQMEQHVSSGEVRTLGISNIYDPSALARLHADAEVKPSVVQNRFYAETRHDGQIRAFCQKHAMAYQSFWTLTGNKRLLEGRAVREVARAHTCTVEQAWLGFVRALGVTPLSGSTSREHMAHDLALPTLSAQEVTRLGRLIS